MKLKGIRDKRNYPNKKWKKLQGQCPNYATNKIRTAATCSVAVFAISRLANNVNLTVMVNLENSTTIKFEHKSSQVCVGPKKE
uniref:Uncharacterized protein n=1 Tax=Panagrolaimus sp. JU765 TaxID=591449 RepID=A0AC34Q574_9BILA